jgi:hypothetical protein
MDRARHLDATDEMRRRSRQVDQCEISGSKLVAMPLPATDPQHLRPEKRLCPSSISVGEVEQIVRHSQTVPGGMHGVGRADSGHCAAMGLLWTILVILLIVVLVLFLTGRLRRR